MPRLWSALLVSLGLLATAAAPAEPSESVARAADGVAVHVYAYGPATPSAAAPTPILMFHQAGGDARGELGPIARELAAEGRPVFTADLRSGGDRFGGLNQTARDAPAPAGYCEVYPDVVAALSYAHARVGRPVLVVGSSYSAALVVKLTAEHPDLVAGFVSFSPAGGPPMAGCEPEPFLKALKRPGLGVRNTPSASIPWVRESNRLWAEAGVPMVQVDAQGHGASLLLADRTTGDSAAARAAFRGFIAGIDRRSRGAS